MTLSQERGTADSPARYETSSSPGSGSPYGGSTSRSTINVGGEERILSVAAGAVLSILGLKVRGLSGLAMLAGGAAMAHRGYTGKCKVSEMMGRNTARAAMPEDYFAKSIHVDASCTIQKPKEELYRFWRNFENLPRFMKHVESVRNESEEVSHWVVKAPAGQSVEWDARIVNEVENELIAWQSLDGADVDNTGTVRFMDAPGGRGTQVRVVLNYIPPGGALGKWVAMLFGEAPELTVRSDLQRFKQLMESGEVPTTEGQSRGTGLV